MQHLHLVIPSRLPAEELDGQAGRAAPSLLKLLARGEIKPPEAGLSAACCRAFGVDQQQDWPLAAITANSDGLATEQMYWLRIDPVYLEVGMGGLIMHDPAILQLTREEALALTSDLNRLWPDNPILCPQPARWYLRLPTPPRLATNSLDRLHGAPLTPHLPVGEDAARFMRLINEAQMALHAHPVNQAREAAGRPVVNSLWLWGGGQLPCITRAPDLVAAKQFEARALAELAGSVLAPCPLRLEETGPWNQAGHVLIVLPDPDAELNSLEHLSQLEQAWFRPLLRRLMLGRIGQLSLELLAEPGLPDPGLGITVNSRQTWRFWRSALALSAALKPAPCARR